MKTIILTIAAFLFSVGVFSYNDESTVVYTNVDGYTKECTTIDKATSQPLKKTVYQNNEQGQRIAKLDYIWDSSNGWVNDRKTEYDYGSDNKITVTLLKWDSDKQKWIAEK